MKWKECDGYADVSPTMGSPLVTLKEENDGQEDVIKTS
ncbi:hypothetical protein QE357_004579 [Siphonobacter sp. BAB-5404]|nr:hypothetical protein [Siphonobacter sp. SORGH_AS_0500]